MQINDKNIRDDYLNKFCDQWQDNALLMDKWFAVQAISKHEDAIENIHKLLSHPKFDANNPNKIYALLAAFASQNPYKFHDISKKGYELISKQIIRLDKTNPQVASRLVRAFMSWNQYSEPHKSYMLDALKYMSQSCKSKDVMEIIEKSIS